MTKAGRRAAWFGTAATVVLAAAVAWLMSPHAERPASDAIRVLTVSTAKVAAKVGGGRPAPVTLPSPAALETLALPDRQSRFASLPRREPWATQTEARLRERMAGRIRGLGTDSLRCAAALCRVTGTLAAGEGSLQSGVDLLKSGPLEAVYADLGLSGRGLVTIEADDTGTLHFVQYLKAMD